MRPDRVVIGSNESDAIAIMKDLYRPLYLIETPIVITSLEAAELIKYAANAFLATKITFINEVANLCDAIGCDVHDVARGMASHRFATSLMNVIFVARKAFAAYLIVPPLQAK